MYIKTERLVIRDLEQKDMAELTRIVWQKNVLKFMKDWSENTSFPGVLQKYIDWHQKQKNSTDVYESKRYAVVLPSDDKLIGIVGMGLEDIVNEVEMAYFIDEEHQGKDMLLKRCLHYLIGVYLCLTYHILF